MDDTAQKQNNPINQPLQQTGQTQVINNNTVSPPDQKIADTQFVPVVSSLNKEVGGTVSEIIKPSEEEVKIEEELSRAGVVANTDKPKLDKIHEQIGVKASLESTPVESKPKGKVSLPMTEDEADKTLKSSQSKFNLHENIEGEYTEDSLPFFAALIKKIYQEMRRRFFRQQP